MRYVADHNINADNLLAKVQAAIDSDKVYEVIVRELLKEYTDEQRCALWGLAYEILADETGNDPEDLHLYFCGEHFGWREFTVMGQLRKVPVRSTTKNERGERDVISTIALANFFEFIQRRSAMNGYHIPDPDPNWKKRMRNDDQAA